MCEVAEFLDRFTPKKLTLANAREILELWKSNTRERIQGEIGNLIVGPGFYWNKGKARTVFQIATTKQQIKYTLFLDDGSLVEPKGEMPVFAHNVDYRQNYPLIDRTTGRPWKPKRRPEGQHKHGIRQANIKHLLLDQPLVLSKNAAKVAQVYRIKEFIPRPQEVKEFLFPTQPEVDIQTLNIEIYRAIFENPADFY